MSSHHDKYLHSSAELAIALAVTFARMQQRSCTNIYHLFVAILANDVVKTALVRCGADFDRLTSESNALMHSRPATPSLGEAARSLITWRHGAIVTHQVHRVIDMAVAHATGIDGKRVTPLHLLETMYRGVNQEIVDVLHGAHLTWLNLAYFIAHGTAEKDDVITPPDGDEAEHDVLLYNDDYTTMETVVEILQNVFGVDSDHAKDIMMRVHHSGRAAAGQFRRSEAIRLQREATMLARQRLGPLRITVEPLKE